MLSETLGRLLYHWYNSVVKKIYVMIMKRRNLGIYKSIITIVILITIAVYAGERALFKWRVTGLMVVPSDWKRLVGFLGIGGPKEVPRRWPNCFNFIFPILDRIIPNSSLIIEYRILPSSLYVEHCAIECLAALQVEDSIPYLVNYVQRKDNVLRIEAIRTLVLMKYEDMPALLERLLLLADIEERILGAIGVHLAAFYNGISDEIISLAGRMSEDPDPQIRLRAIRVIELMEVKVGEGFLLELIRDNDIEVRDRAKELYFSLALCHASVWASCANIQPGPKWRIE